MSTLVCPECGARLAEGVERCDLCGAPIPDAAESLQPTDEPGNGDIPEPKTDSGMDAAVCCNACGRRNPPDANFCSRCGAQVQPARPETRSVPAGAKHVDAGAVAAGEPAAETESGLGRHVAVLIGFSVLVVIALYMITVISKQQVENSGDRTVEAPADVRSAAVIDEYEAIPIGERFAPTVDSLRAAIASGEASAAHATRRELVDFLIDIGRVDRAAIEQQRLARDTDDVDDWRRAGNLLYDWMESVNNERKTDVALLTIDAYERVLEQAPDDLDARADLGWAYQYDPQNPMQAIQHTNIVLEENADHLAANYNRGVFLLRINRVADAVAQFERVVDLAEEGSLYARQAQAWIRTVQEQQSEQP